MQPVVAMNALALRTQGSGVQTYIRELLGALSRHPGGLRFEVRCQRDVVDLLPRGVTPRAVPCADGIRRAALGALPFRDADLVHGLDVDLPLVRGRAPRVCTVHDLAVFDRPDAFSSVRARGERALLRRSIGTADAVIAVSGFTAGRVREVFGREADVVWLAPGSEMTPPEPTEVARVRARYDLPERFVLQVASIEPRKDVHRLAGAARRAGIDLVLAGSVKTAVPAGALVLGWVEQADLPALYAAATVVAYVSTYEGFGLPPVEAMACGAAVLATAVGAVPDVTGDGAALVPPESSDRLDEALARLVDDDVERARLRKRGPEVASRLSWAAAATATTAVYQRLLAR